MLRKCFQAALACLFVAAFSQVDQADAAAAGTPPAHAADAAAAGDPGPGQTLPRGGSQPPADIVLLIDGSLGTSPAPMPVFRLEVAVATAIALSEPNPDSRVAVSVFGSRDDPRQESTDPVCIADRVGDRAERSDLEDCLGKAAPRIGDEGGEPGRVGEGRGTDLPAALRQALAILDQSDKNRDKVVFILSDGVPGIDDTSSYPGPDNKDEERNRDAGIAVGRLLSEDFSPQGIQIWPISFGGAVEAVPTPGVAGGQMLDVLAVGSGRGRCSPADAIPSPHVVGVNAAPVDAVAIGLAALADARCLAYADRVDPDRRPDGTSTFDVTVPLWAETAALTVVGAGGVGALGDEGQIDVSDPDGRRVDDRSGDETIIDGLREPALATVRVQRPVSGRWRLSAPSTTEHLGAFVTWSGEPMAALLVRPARPHVDGDADTGSSRDEVALTVRVFSRENAFRGGNLLDLKVDVRVTGDGMEEKLERNLKGAVPDPDVGDVAEFTRDGIELPAAATGALRFEALIRTGRGRSTVSRVVHTSVAGPTGWEKVPPIEVRSDDDVSVSPGESAVFELDGTLGYKNRTPVRVRLRDMTVPGIAVSPEDEEVQVPGRRDVVSLVVPKDAPPGRVHGVAEVFNPDHPEVVLSMTPIDFEITAGPGTWSMVSWLAASVLVAAVASIFLAAADTARRRRRARAPKIKTHPVGGLCLWLERGNVFEDYLQARDDDGTELYFDIVDADTLTPRFARAAPDHHTGVLKGTTDPGRFEIDWSNGLDPDVLRLGGKSKTTYGSLIVEVTGHRSTTTPPSVDGGAS